MLQVLSAIIFYAAPLDAGPQARGNRDVQAFNNFQKRIAEYVKLRSSVRAGLSKLKPARSPGTIAAHELDLAGRIRQARCTARRGDIFTPEISAGFRHLIEMVMRGQEATRVQQSLRAGAPVHLKALRINQVYPAGVPLQSMPPTLLLTLPKLPKEMEYRVVGHALVLLDTEANLIVDFIPDAIP